jgi:hypothetical protein
MSRMTELNASNPNGGTPSQPLMTTLRTSALAAVAGGSLGIALNAAMVVMASAGPTGDEWSFRGNGALVVPIAFGAALLAGGWVGLFLYARGVPAWAPFAMVIALSAAAPAVLSIFVLVIFGSAAQLLSDLMTVPALVWPAVSLVCIVIADLRPARSRRLPHAAALFAALVFSVALGGGFFGAEAFVAPGSG